MSYVNQLHDILERARVALSDLDPADWSEQNRVLTTDVSSRPGPHRFDYTPYMREIINCLSSDHMARIVAVMKGAQIGFALDINTPIMTVSGWKSMLNVRVGDFVFDENGKPCEVIKVSRVMKNHKCYAVKFTDGSTIKCDADHLWTVKDLKLVKRTWTTDRLSKNVKQVRGSGQVRSRYSIDNCKPVEMSYKKLPIDPYLFGLWLGDGSMGGNSITAILADAIEYQRVLNEKGIESEIKPYKNQPNTVNLRIKDAFNSFKGGTKFKRKYIPDIYKTASVSQRLELLQGLIDTDGHVMKDGKVEFYNIDKTLIDDVYELISSLGYKATTRLRENEDAYVRIVPGRVYKSKPLFVINFMGTAEIPVARLPRKRDRLRPSGTIRQEITKRWISEIKECESVPVKCIAINSETHLYLAGKSFIPTHNSLNVIESGIGWIISQNPGNILFLSGHADLAEEAMNQRIDAMIDTCGLRPLIRPNVLRTRNQRTGDTNKSKEFPGGWLIAGSGSNHKLLRQRSARYGFFDDFEAAKKSSTAAGSTRKLFEQRFAAYYDKMKIMYSSSPELKINSNIEPVYELGDQRRYYIPCQCCGEYIPLLWTVEISGTKDKGGITWQVNERGELIPGSVGYTCQICGGFFDDSHKYEFNLAGEWRATAKPSEVGYYSYHISSLYAPPGMYDWEYYVRQYLEANPPEGRKEELHKAFVNLCLGETYEHKGHAPEANQVQSKIRSYKIGTIPEWMSEKDGNGKIILLTCACDLNGTEQDARLDYEVVAWSETGSNYNIVHGSIGTFVYREGQQKVKDDRARWTYEHNKTRSVWPELENILGQVFETDTGRKMKIAVTGVDCGHYTNHAYAFIDKTKIPFVFGIKGDKEEAFRKYKADMPLFKPAKERANLFLLDVNYIKDLLAEIINLQWDTRDNASQPPGYMNFPTPENGLYLFKDYFSHYEAEHRADNIKDGVTVGTRWVKKNTNVQNHFWDVCCYNFALKELFAALALKESPKKKGTWADFVNIVLGK